MQKKRNVSPKLAIETIISQCDQNWASCAAFYKTEEHCAKLNSETNKKEWKTIPNTISKFHFSCMCYLCFKINSNLNFHFISKLQWFLIIKGQLSITKIAIFKWRFLKINFFEWYSSNSDINHNFHQKVIILVSI